jgi:hypothetical protein
VRGLPLREDDMRRFATVASITVALLLPTTPALAFHHVGLPDCGADIAGNNATARAALIAHNPAQDLPLPPVGTPAAPAAGDVVANPPCP